MRAEIRKSRRSRLAIAAVAQALCALTFSACGDTLQETPIGAASFESVIVNSRMPVYWLGLRFKDLEASNVREDPGGAITIDYGNCLVGGQYTCITPLQIVTSPDNSFVPGGGAGAQAVSIRGVRALSSEGGAALAIATGPVVVSVYAERPSLARAAAQAMTPFNEPGLTEAPLPRSGGDTGFDRLPLRSQVPPGQGVPRLR